MRTISCSLTTTHRRTSPANALWGLRWLTPTQCTGLEACRSYGQYTCPQYQLETGRGMTLSQDTTPSSRRYLRLRGQTLSIMSIESLLPLVQWPAIWLVWMQQRTRPSWLRDQDLWALPTKAATYTPLVALRSRDMSPCNRSRTYIPR